MSLSLFFSLTIAIPRPFPRSLRKVLHGSRALPGTPLQESGNGTGTTDGEEADAPAAEPLWEGRLPGRAQGGGVLAVPGGKSGVVAVALPGARVATLSAAAGLRVAPADGEGGSDDDVVPALVLGDVPNQAGAVVVADALGRMSLVDVGVSGAARPFWQALCGLTSAPLLMRAAACGRRRFALGAWDGSLELHDWQGAASPLRVRVGHAMHAFAVAPGDDLRLAVATVHDAHGPQLLLFPRAVLDQATGAQPLARLDFVAQVRRALGDSFSSLSDGELARAVRHEKKRAGAIPPPE